MFINKEEQLFMPGTFLAGRRVQKVKERVACSKQLSPKEVRRYSLAEIFSGKKAWLSVLN